MTANRGRCRTDASKRVLAAGCAGLVALLTAACSSCDEGLEHSAWGVTYVSTAEASDASLDAPNCAVDAPDTDSAGAKVDPELLEIARLEVERDCYKRAERELRYRIASGDATRPLPSLK
jgi:hypothetical protein